MQKTIRTGDMTFWSAVAIVLGAPFLAAILRYTANARDPVQRYVARHKPLAGPRPGAELPS